MKDRMDVLAKIFEKVGLSKERFRVEYVSAAEGVKFAAIMKEMTEQLEELGPEKIKAENQKLKPKLDKMLARKKKKK
jgi:coenzyme F420-reducing hydrogenase delta subunit